MCQPLNELQTRFWESLVSDRVVMLGLSDVDGQLRPVTAQFDDAHSPLWFFTSKDNELVRGLGARNRGIATYASKGHELFATLQGALTLDTDRRTV